MNKEIAVFESTRAAISAERICVAAGLSCQVIPVPRDISAECGIALEINKGDREAVEKIFRQEKLQVKFYNKN
jgi:hypothetical protein